jgi:hypothetical protein
VWHCPVPRRRVCRGVATLYIAQVNLPPAGRDRSVVKRVSVDVLHRSQVHRSLEPLSTRFVPPRVSSVADPLAQNAHIAGTLYTRKPQQVRSRSLVKIRRPICVTRQDTAIVEETQQMRICASVFLTLTHPEPFAWWLEGHLG